METEQSNLINILSLCVALLAVITGPFVAWLINKKQTTTAVNVATKQIISPMRQAWIESLRTTVSEILSTFIWFYISGTDEVTPINEDDDYEEIESYDEQKVQRKLFFLISKVELMLNSNEEDHTSLLNNLKNAQKALFSSGNEHVKFYEFYENSIKDCKKVLKREWERVKHEV